ncbi:MAG: hypothetical protein N3E42_07320, partial [Candidatus Bipolaricaulota bacterium]|nr:hypothetical protein [Candidatus Bipolaricaulota bacterium]
MRRSNGETPWQLTVYIPKEKRHEQLLERLRKIAQEQKRSLNFLVLEAVEIKLKKSRGELEALPLDPALPRSPESFWLSL